MLKVVSKSLKLFCVIFGRFQIVVESSRIFILFNFSFQIVWSVLFVKLFQVVVGGSAYRKFF